MPQLVELIKPTRNTLPVDSPVNVRSQIFLTCAEPIEVKFSKQGTNLIFKAGCRTLGTPKNQVIEFWPCQSQHFGRVRVYTEMIPEFWELTSRFTNSQCQFVGISEIASAQLKESHLVPFHRCRISVSREDGGTMITSHASFANEQNPPSPHRGKTSHLSCEQL